MKDSFRFLAIGMAAFCAVVMSGCSGTEIKDKIVSQISGDENAQETPAPAPTEAPATPTATPVPATPTPMPTSTPAPRRIGTKTPQSKYVFLMNGLTEALREVYLRDAGGEDWGKNLIPVESTVKAGEQVQMCYTPSDASGGLYDMRFVDKKGNSYGIFEINISDFESATVRMENGEPFLSYISLTTGDETRADYSEILAQDYDYSSSSDSGDSHEGDYNYGYYDDYGNWVSYYSDSSSSGSSSGSTSSGSSNEGDPNYGYYDDYGNWVSYYSDSSSSSDSSYETYYDSSGMQTYGTGTATGYYDDYGNYITY